MKLLLYCTKAKPYLYRQDDDTFKLENKIVYEDISNYKKYYGLNNGKIVAECDFEVENINCSSVFNYCYATWNLGQDELLKFSCLERKQLVDYLGYENQIDGKWCGYAIHIRNLHIFDKPRELNDYNYLRTSFFGTLGNAPQNMMYAYDNGEKKILISIRPEWLCKILNGEKIIEVRKKVLKEMLG